MSALTNLNSTVFANEVGTKFTTFGVEYWSNPENRDEGFIQWVADQPVFRINNNVLSGDPSLNISSRLISEEPMSIILNLAISGMFFFFFLAQQADSIECRSYLSSVESFQKVDLASMTFPAELRVDYVRVWQRKGLENGVGCDPPSKIPFIKTALYVVSSFVLY